MDVRIWTRVIGLRSRLSIGLSWTWWQTYRFYEKCVETDEFVRKPAFLVRNLKHGHHNKYSHSHPDRKWDSISQLLCGSGKIQEQYENRNSLETEINLLYICQYSFRTLERTLCASIRKIHQLMLYKDVNCFLLQESCGTQVHAHTVWTKFGVFVA